MTHLPISLWVEQEIMFLKRLKNYVCNYHKRNLTWGAFVGVGTTPMGPKLAMPMQTCPGPRRAGGRSGGRLRVLTKRCIAPSDCCCVVSQLQLHRTLRMKEKRNVFCDLDVRSTRREEADTGRCEAPAVPPRLFSRCTLELEAKWPAQGLSLVQRE